MNHKPYSVTAMQAEPVKRTGKRLGAMIYSHKTGAELQIMEAEDFERYKKHSSRKGQSSCLRNTLVAGGRLQ